MSDDTCDIDLTTSVYVIPSLPLSSPDPVFLEWTAARAAKNNPLFAAIDLNLSDESAVSVPHMSHVCWTGLSPRALSDVCVSAAYLHAHKAKPASLRV